MNIAGMTKKQAEIIIEKSMAAFGIFN